jgi:hypothetical protein
VTWSYLILSVDYSYIHKLLRDSIGNCSIVICSADMALSSKHTLLYKALLSSSMYVCNKIVEGG